MRYFILLLSIGLFGCAGEEVVRGHVVRDYQEEGLRAEVLKKGDIVRLMGSPSLESADGRRWFYVSHVAEVARFWSEKLKEREVYVMTFDEVGILRGWERRKEKGVEVVVSEEETEDPGTKLYLFRELFGRIGTIDFRNRTPGQGG